MRVKSARAAESGLDRDLEGRLIALCLGVDGRPTDEGVGASGHRLEADEIASPGGEDLRERIPPQERERDLAVIPADDEACGLDHVLEPVVPLRLAQAARARLERMRRTRRDHP